MPVGDHQAPEPMKSLVRRYHAGKWGALKEWETSTPTNSWLARFAKEISHFLRFFPAAAPPK